MAGLASTGKPDSGSVLNLLTTQQLRETRTFAAVHGPASEIVMQLTGFCRIGAALSPCNSLSGVSCSAEAVSPRWSLSEPEPDGDLLASTLLLLSFIIYSKKGWKLFSHSNETYKHESSFINH